MTSGLINKFVFLMLLCLVAVNAHILIDAAVQGDYFLAGKACHSPDFTCGGVCCSAKEYNTCCDQGVVLCWNENITLCNM